MNSMNRTTARVNQERLENTNSKFWDVVLFSTLALIILAAILFA